MSEPYSIPSVNDLLLHYEIKAREEIDNFVFEAIVPYCEYVMEMKLDKNLLKRALTEYFQNHPEERKGL